MNENLDLLDQTVELNQMLDTGPPNVESELLQSLIQQYKIDIEGKSLEEIHNEASRMKILDKIANYSPVFPDLQDLKHVYLDNHTLLGCLSYLYIYYNLPNPLRLPGIFNRAL
jgi:hypothetical protein